MTATEKPAKTDKANPASGLSRGVYWVAGTGAVLSLGAAAFGGPSAALSTGIGSALATANLWALGRIVAAFLAQAQDEDDQANELEDDQADDDDAAPRVVELSQAERREARGRGAVWSVFATLKLIGLFAVVFWLIQRNIVSPIPFVLGYCALPVGITLGAVFPAPRARRKVSRRRPSKT